MTTTANSNKITGFIVPIIPVNVMNFSFSNLIANSTLIRSCFSRHGLKPSVPVFIRMGVLFNAKSNKAFSTTKSPSAFKTSRVADRKLFFTMLTSFFYLPFLRFFKACTRTISYIRMLKPRFQKFKFNTASFTGGFNPRYHHSLVSTFFSAKALFLIFDSIGSNLKTSVANSANQSAACLLKIILTNSRAKKRCISFNFIRVGLKRLITFRALCDHRSHDCIWANLNQRVN